MTFPAHSHDNEQLTYILEGALHFWFGENGERELTARAGEVIVIPSNVPHRALAPRGRTTRRGRVLPTATGLAGRHLDAYLEALRRMGKAIAQALVAEGACVAICARGPVQNLMLSNSLMER